MLFNTPFTELGNNPGKLRKTKGNVSYLIRTIANKNAFSFLLKEYKINQPTFPSSLSALGRTRYKIFPRFAAGYTSPYTWRPITCGSHDYITSKPELYESRLCYFPPFVANGNDLHHDAVSISYSCCRLLGERKRPPTKWESKNRGKSLQQKDEK